MSPFWYLKIKSLKYEAVNTYIIMHAVYAMHKCV